MSTITQSISSLGDVPTTADPSTFDSRADTFLGTALPNLRTEINTWAGQANTVAGEVNTNATIASNAATAAGLSEDNAVAAANFMGQWSLLTGAAAVPYSVEHNGVFWTLLSSIADITAKEPGVAAEWAAMNQTTRETRTSNTILGPGDHGKIIEYTSGTFSQTFAAAALLGESWYCYVINTGTGTVTLDPNASETIGGASTKALRFGVMTFVICDGTNFQVYDQPTFPGVHRVIVHTGNGHGSTNTKVRRFTTAQETTGTAITYADSSTNGGTFTVNEDGLYSVYYVDSASTGSVLLGLSVNSAELTTNIQSITASTRVGVASSNSANELGVVTRLLRLSRNDVVRAHTDGAPNATSAYQTTLVIEKVSQ